MEVLENVGSASLSPEPPGELRAAVDLTTRRARLAVAAVAAYTFITVASCAFALIESWPSVAMLVLASWSVLRIASAVLYCRWLHRAWKDNGLLEGRTLSMSAGAAVASFFIPIVSLFRPYQAVKELYEASDPETLPDRPQYVLTEGSSYRATSGALISTPDYRRPFPVRAWWAAYLVSSINIRLMGYSTWAIVAVTVVVVSTLVGAVLAIRVMQAIVARQRERLRRLEALAVSPAAAR
jgi:Domain of unknown function (DUF4328)